MLSPIFQKREMRHRENHITRPCGSGASTMNVCPLVIGTQVFPAHACWSELFFPEVGFFPAQKTPLHTQLYPHEPVCFFHPESPGRAGEGRHLLQLLLQEAQQRQQVAVLRVRGMCLPTIASHPADQGWEPWGGKAGRGKARRTRRGVRGLC